VTRPPAPATSGPTYISHNVSRGSLRHPKCSDKNNEARKSKCRNCEKTADRGPQTPIGYRVASKFDTKEKTNAREAAAANHETPAPEHQVGGINGANDQDKQHCGDMEILVTNMQ
jgi:hypothetical protein